MVVVSDDRLPPTVVAGCTRRSMTIDAMSVCHLRWWWLFPTEATALLWLSLKAVIGKGDLIENVHVWPWVGPDVIRITFDPQPVVELAPSKQDLALQLDTTSHHRDVHCATHGVRAIQLKGGLHWGALVERVDPRRKAPTVHGLQAACMGA